MALKSIICNIDTTNLRQIRSYLFDTDYESDDEPDCVGPNSTRGEDSMWEDVVSEDEDNQSSERPAEPTNPRKDTTSWLQDTLVATIPNFELFVFASGKRIFALELTADKGQWRQLFKKELSDADITAVVCLPVAPIRVTDPRPVDWTAILVGLGDGNMMALNERGEELLTHRFHAKPVMEMNLQTDQLFISYRDHLVAISGFTLLASLKTSRSRALRQRAPYPPSSENSHSETFSAANSLVYEYWQLENTSQPGGVISTGAHRTSLWEKLVTASIKGGFNAVVSSRQPSYETFCAASSNNFISFNWWTDDTAPNILGGLASRIKSSVSVPLFSSSWWSPSKPSSKTPSASTATITSRNVPQRSCLPDDGRIGERIVLAPGDRLAAVCDDIGRVSIVDVQRRLLIRMWKGYRDAQCAWIEVPYAEQEKKDGQQNRCNLLCLIIFAPRRGILEVWSAQNGRRVAAFNVDRKGVLIYCPITAITRSCVIDHSQALCFLDSTGHFFQIDISAAVVTNQYETSTYWTVPAKEEFRKHWNKEFSEQSSLTATLEILGRLSSTSDISYLVDQIIGSSKIDYKLFIQLVDAVSAHLTKGGVQSPGSRFLYARCLAYRQITHFAAMVRKFYASDSPADADNFPMANDDDICKLLALQSADELNSLMQDLDNNLKLRFLSFGNGNEDVDLSLVMQQFFSAIDERKLLHGSISPGWEMRNLRLTFKKDIDPVVLADLGDFIFKPFLIGSGQVEEFQKSVLPLLGLIARDWTRLFCAYWLNKNRSYSIHPLRLYNLFCALYDYGSSEMNGEFLREVRHLLVECSRTAEALSLCVVVRAMIKNRLSIDSERKDRLSTEAESQEPLLLPPQLKNRLSIDSDWCKVEKDAEDWDSLQSVLHSLLLLDTCRNAIMGKNRSEFDPISVRQLLINGASALSEYLAKAFIHAEEPVNCDSLNDPTGHAPWSNALSRARELLPLSLETERVLTNILWEYVRLWHKEPSRADCLCTANKLLGDLQDDRLRHGFARMAWRTFFRQHYEKLCLLMMQSNGKDCSEQFECETAIPACSLMEFVRFVFSLFSVMRERMQWQQNGRHYETEDFLHNFFSAFRHDVPSDRVNSDETLLILLLRKSFNGKCRIEWHWQLAAAVLMAVSTNFETRLMPLSLFSWDQRADLFKHLSSSSEHVGLSDEDAEQQVLSNRRLLFLLSYVTVAIKTNQSPLPEATPVNLLPDLSLAVKLARAWELNFDAIRRQEIVQLYIAGFPDLASKLLALVEDRRQLASTLLDIVGCALSDRFDSSIAKLWPKLSATLRDWLKARKSSKNAKGPELSMDSCRAMLDYVCSTISSTSSEYKLAHEMKSVVGEFGKVIFQHAE